MRRNVVIAVVIAAAAGMTAGACELMGPSSDCPDSVHLTVRQRSTVVFDWAPWCRGGGLSVTDVESLETVWIVQDVGRPPVTYGRAPRRSREAFTAVPLVPGRAYRAVLDVPRGGPVLFIGTAVFVRSGQQ
jgi:hypothetical protein